MGKNTDAHFGRMNKVGEKDITELDPGEELKVKQYQFKVTKELAQEYAEDIIDDRNPWYYDQSPFGDPICPPSLICNDYLNVIVENGFNNQGSIFYRGQFEFLYPLRQGRMITETVRPIQKYEKRGRTWIDYYMEIVDDEGNLLIRGTATEALAYSD